MPQQHDQYFSDGNFKPTQQSEWVMDTTHYLILDTLSADIIS